MQKRPQETNFVPTLDHKPDTMGRSVQPVQHSNQAAGIDAKDLCGNASVAAHRVIISPSTMEMEPATNGATGIQPSQSAKIEVIGVGGGGSNAVNRMIISDLEGVAYRVLNTDAQALIQSQAQNRLQLGQTLTRGLGAGGNPTIGQKAAEESRADLQ